MRIFGYGSLLSADAIAEHKLGTEKFTENDLQEAQLKDYSRSFNAFDGRFRYLGLTKKNGTMVSGVIFDILDSELPRFKKVEGVPDLYTLLDVSANIRPFQSDPVYTLVTKAPSARGAIPADYLQQVRGALKHRSIPFQHRFHAETRLP